MPNTLIKSIAGQAGVKKSKVEQVWQELKNEYGNNYKAIVGGLKKAFNYTAQDTNRTLTEWNHLKVDDCVITAEAVNQYLGKELAAGRTQEEAQSLRIEPDKIYNVYRPASEIKKAIDTYQNVPLVNEHHFVDDIATNKDKWLGTIGTDLKIVNGKLMGSVAVWDKNGIELINRHKEGLSAGYKFNLDNTKGEWDGKPYDFKMKDIVCNHVALVSSPRVVEAKVADALLNWQTLEKENNERNDMKAEEVLAILKKSHPEVVEKAEKELENGEEGKDKKTKDESVNREHTGKGESTDEESDMEDEKKDEDDEDREYKKSMKDRKKSKDEEMKRTKESKEHSSKPMTGDDISLIVKQQLQKQLTAYNTARELCEKAVGRVNFATDATPDDMYNVTLQGLGRKYDGYTIDTKIALLEDIAVHKQYAPSVNAITDSVYSSGGVRGKFSIFSGDK